MSDLWLLHNLETKKSNLPITAQKSPETWAPVRIINVDLNFYLYHIANMQEIHHISLLCQRHNRGRRAIYLTNSFALLLGVICSAPEGAPWRMKAAVCDPLGSPKTCTGFHRTEPKRLTKMRYGIHKKHKARDMITKCRSAVRMAEREISHPSQWAAGSGRA